MEYRVLYETGKEKLEASAIAEAALDARLLLEYVCGTDRNTLLVHPEREVSVQEEETYRALLEKRAVHIPLQHLTGVQDFMGLEFAVNEHVLIPRQDTEILVEEVMREPFDGAEILDLCTGSGCILLSLLHYSNHCHGVGVDISPEALQVAECNAGRLEISDGQVEFLEGDLYEALEPGRKFDLLVSNPPYIQSGVIPTLMPEVREHEPLLALDGMEDGLFFYRKIIKQAPEWLRAGAGIYFEIGFDQALAVEQLLREAGFTEIRTVQDYAGLDRVVCARL